MFVCTLGTCQSYLRVNEDHTLSYALQPSRPDWPAPGTLRPEQRSAAITMTIRKGGALVALVAAALVAGAVASEYTSQHLVHLTNSNFDEKVRTSLRCLFFGEEG